MDDLGVPKFQETRILLKMLCGSMSIHFQSMSLIIGGWLDRDLSRPVEIRCNTCFLFEKTNIGNTSVVDLSKISSVRFCIFQKGPVSFQRFVTQKFVDLQ